MLSARVDFDTDATLARRRADVKSERLDLGDFFAMWHFDQDPRFDGLAGRGTADARVQYEIGGKLTSAAAATCASTFEQNSASDRGYISASTTTPEKRVSTFRWMDQGGERSRHATGRTERDLEERRRHHPRQHQAE